MAVTLKINLNQVSQSVANNTSKVRARVYAVSTGGSWNGDPCSGSLTLNGVKYSFSHSFSANTTTLLYDTTRTISHNSDGSKTVSASARFVTGVSSGTITTTASLQLDKINRRSLINSIASFNIETGTTVSITKYVSGYTDTLRIYQGSTLIKTITNISNGDKVTFTENELERLFNLSKTSNSISLKFTLTTYNGTTSVGSTSVNAIGLIQNANPCFISVNTSDNSSITTALTGDNQKYIKGNSSLEVNVKAVSLKGSEISHFLLNSTMFSANYDNVESSYKGVISIQNISDNYYNIYAVDTRGNSILNQVTLDYIDYFNIEKGVSSCERKNQTGEDTTISFEGSFWNNDFNSNVANTIEATYKYKDTQSNSYVNGTTPLILALNGNNFSFSGAIKGDTNTGFDISNTYDVVVTVKDKLNSKDFVFRIPAGKPGIAIYKNNVAIHGGYDTSLGGTQINGDMFLNGTLLTNEFMQLTLNKEINITINANGFSAFSGALENYDEMSQSQRLSVERRTVTFEDRTDYNVTGVTIGKNVSKIKATAEVRYRNMHSADMSISTIIYRVRNGVAESFSGASQGVITLYRYTCNLTGYIDVEEGDFIFCGSYKAVKESKVTAQATDNATRFIVECVG